MRNGDKQLQIAVGKNRFDEKWKNGVITWSELVKKLSVTHRTHEKLLDYMAMPKDKQGNIKDIGGFVGGHIKDGKREINNIVSRSLLALDVDYADSQFWTELEMFCNYAVCCYSTHKHTSKAPRFRLIIPLDREVSSEEYEALSRKVADMWGIDKFDDSTYQPNRLMYWPSTAKDGEYFFKVLDYEFLEVDKVLAEYSDWKDVTQWPQSSRISEIHRKSAVKQGDPLAKDGVVGAFCRTYSVSAAIDKFLSDVYEVTSKENRYTYINGSTSGGLVVYEDDNFAYSNHSTDPAGGYLCNAFDLVRLHKFSHLDENLNEMNRGRSRPSFLAMMEFATKDEEVKLNIAKESFEVLEEDAEENKEVSDWVKKIELDKKGKVIVNYKNIRLILRNDPKFKDALAYDKFAMREMAIKPLPWFKDDEECPWALVDSEDAKIREYLGVKYDLQCPRIIQDVLQSIMRDNSYHPVKQYLDSLAWDGVSRLDTLFIDYLGAEDSEYVRAVTRKTLCSAVARIYKPGTKFDHALTFTGEPGIGKSSLIKKLGGDWVSDSVCNLDRGKEAYEMVQGVWLVELAELSAITRASVEATKNFISKTDDRYRVAYGHRTESHLRQCVFFASTNATNFLKDETGNRRFWVVEVQGDRKTKDIWSSEFSEKIVPQIWAEAKYRFEKGEPLHLKIGLEQEANRIQEEHEIDDPRLGLIEAFLEKPICDGWYDRSIESRQLALSTGGSDMNMYREKICVLEIWCECFNKRKEDLKKYDSLDIANLVKRSMFIRNKKSKTMRFGEEYGVQKGFEILVL